MGRLRQPNRRQLPYHDLAVVARIMSKPRFLQNILPVLVKLHLESAACEFPIRPNLIDRSQRVGKTALFSIIRG